MNVVVEDVLNTCKSSPVQMICTFEDVVGLQVWLQAKAIDYPAVRHLQQQYGLPSTEAAPTQQDSSSLQKAITQQSLDGKDRLEQDRGVDRDALYRITGRCPMNMINAACC